MEGKWIRRGKILQIRALSEPKDKKQKVDLFAHWMLFISVCHFQDTYLLKSFNVFICIWYRNTFCYDMILSIQTFQSVALFYVDTISYSEFRGGVHFTWQIKNPNNICNCHIVFLFSWLLLLIFHLRVTTNIHFGIYSIIPHQIIVKENHWQNRKYKEEIVKPLATQGSHLATNHNLTLIPFAFGNKNQKYFRYNCCIEIGIWVN